MDYFPGRTKNALRMKGWIFTQEVFPAPSTKSVDVDWHNLSLEAHYKYKMTSGFWYRLVHILEVLQNVGLSSLLLANIFYNNSGKKLPKKLLPMYLFSSFSLTPGRRVDRKVSFSAPLLREFGMTLKDGSSCCFGRNPFSIFFFQIQANTVWW